MTHPDDIAEIKKELSAFYDKHANTLTLTDAASYILEALCELQNQMRYEQEKIDEETGPFGSEYQSERLGARQLGVGRYF